jgi:hypothetical protein
MSKINNTSFVDRNNRFEETLLIRDVVSRRSGKPGPDHYSNDLNAPLSPTRRGTSVPANVLRSTSPMYRNGPGATVSTAQIVSEKKHSASPAAGLRDYAFGREELNREGRQQIPFSPRSSALLGGTVMDLRNSPKGGGGGGSKSRS